MQRSYAMPQSIPNDSTVKTVWPHMTHQQNYIEGVFQNLVDCHEVYKNALVRIGITGTGQKPCYRIAYLTSGVESIFGSFWDNHQPLEKKDAINDNWSTSIMSFDEFEAFFRAKYDWKRKFPPSR